MRETISGHYFGGNVRFDTFAFDTYESIRMFQRDTMRFIKASPLPGPTKLLAHIRAGGETVPRFCERHDLPRYQVEKAIKGRLRGMTVALAAAIEKATGGDVVVSDWSDVGADAPTGTDGG